MKKGMKIFGIIFIILGVLAYIASVGMENAYKPTEVKIGYGTGSNFVVTDSGYMGGLSSHGKSVVSMLNGVGIACVVGGVILLLTSRAFPEE